MLHLVWASIVCAENQHPHGIIVDGTIGAKEMKTLQGPDYQIDADLGEIKGNNLFHSFQTFNVHNNEQAVFNGPDNIQHIITRVTGNEYSWIDGTIQSMMPDADFFLFNPNGVVFGKNVLLDIAGAFHVSTCNYIGFSDETRYEAAPDKTLLSTSLPHSFGFIDDNIGQIIIHGKGPTIPQSENSLLPSLIVKNDQTLSLISEGIVLNEGTVDLVKEFPVGTLVANNGIINIASVASTGEVVFQDDGLDVSSFEKMGDITLSDHSVISASSGKVNVYGNYLKMTTSFINAGQYVRDDLIVEGFAGGHIDIHVKRFSLLDGSGIFIETFGSENSGDITIQAEHIELKGRYDENASRISTSSISIDFIENIDPENTFERFSSEPQSFGNAGNIDIVTQSLLLTDSANIMANAFSRGNGGIISINADTLDICGNATIDMDQHAGIFSVSASDGNSGNIFIRSGTLVSLNQHAIIGAQSLGKGRPGGIIIDTPKLSLDHYSIVSATALHEENAKDGLGVIIGRDIVLHDAEKDFDVHQMCDQISIKRYSEISTESYGTGQAGIVYLVSKTIALDDHAIVSSSALKPGNSGHSGEIVLLGEKISLDHESLITTENAGIGDAGTINILTSNLSLDHFSRILSVNTYGTHGGASGLILISKGIESILPNDQTIIHPVDKISMNNHSGLCTSSLSEGGAGAIIVRVKDLIISNAAFISAENKYPGYSEEIGIISIRGENIQLHNESKISTQSESEADAGGIALETNTLSLSNKSYVSSAGIHPHRKGAGGHIFIAKKISHIDDVLFGFIDIEDKLEVKDIFYIKEPVETIKMNDSAFISTSSAGTGDAGGILIGSQNLSLSKGSRISSESTSKTDGGAAGLISISHLKNFHLIQNSKISTQAIHTSVPDTIIPGFIDQDRLNGMISISSTRDISLYEGSISSSVLGGLGNGGNISIHSSNAVLNRSQVIANAYEGNGGNIYIEANYLIQSSDSDISASSHLGIDGEILIEAFTENFDKQIISLTQDFLDATHWIQTPCELRENENSSHFFITRYKVQPASFFDWQPGRYK